MMDVGKKSLSLSFCCHPAENKIKNVTPSYIFTIAQSVSTTVYLLDGHPLRVINAVQKLSLLCLLSLREVTVQGQLNSTVRAGMVSRALLQSGGLPGSGLEPWVMRIKHCLSNCLATLPPTIL